MQEWPPAWAPSFLRREQRGKRSALPNSEIMIHQPSGGVKGQTTDIQIQARRMIDLKSKLNRILAENTGNRWRISKETLSEIIL